MKDLILTIEIQTKFLGNKDSHRDVIDILTKVCNFCSNSL